jgi:hypothetical protein
MLRQIVNVWMERSAEQANSPTVFWFTLPLAEVGNW